MRVLLFLVMSGVLLSQPTSKQDTVPASAEQIPVDIKPTVDKIVENSMQTKKAETAINQEMIKQLDLMKEIKLKVLELKKTTKTKAKPVKEISKLDPIELKAIKEEPVAIEVEGQVVHWETRKRTWLGRLLNAKDILYYPYIIDKDGNKIYLK